MILVTTNQLRFQELQETKRSNLAKERETLRANMARENETRRSNLVKEEEDHRHHNMEAAQTIYSSSVRAMSRLVPLVG